MSRGALLLNGNHLLTDRNTQVGSPKILLFAGATRFEKIYGLDMYLKSLAHATPNILKLVNHNVTAKII